ncbi:PREDICTED: neuronal pentraxin-1, partial [Aptenodytes forsteri]|uniref:neuronal pentraxin-1 n=1 Tax=Aptenodytes forsteri TaxID=9233 RepID=UPI0004F42E72
LFLLLSLLCLRGRGQGFGQTRFICTSVPLDGDMCAASAPGTGSAEELKSTVLQLRETVLQQKETIMNQKETIRELTAKLGRCESQSVLEASPGEPKGGQKDNRPPDRFQLTFPLRTNYMYAKVKKSLPEMYAFSVCMWMKSNASPGMGTPFSYAVPGQANELVLIEWGNNPMEILINDKVAKLPFVINDGKWHHICVTWTTRDGVWEAYQDGTQTGSGENLAPYHPIKPQGVLVLGQEQALQPHGPSAAWQIPGKEAGEQQAAWRGEAIFSKMKFIRLQSEVERRLRPAAGTASQNQPDPGASTPGAHPQATAGDSAQREHQERL